MSQPMRNKARRKKQAVFVRAADGKNPLRGVPLIAYAEDAHGEMTPIGALETGAKGFASFSFKRQLIENAKHIWVAPNDEQEKRIDVLPTLRNTDTASPATIILPNDDRLSLDNGRNLPNIQGPLTAYEWDIAPDLFGFSPELEFGEEACELVVKSEAAVIEYPYYQVTRDRQEAQTLEAGDMEALKLRTGRVSEYRVRWLPARHTLGELLYSLPLAPCESANLAVIDWSREDMAVRTEEQELTEDLIHSQRRDRLIEETVEASLRELQAGGSFMEATSAAIKIPPLAISKAVGISASASGGIRDLQGETMNRLADSIVQASSAVRRLRSTVVVQASQAESERIETRTIQNHNHNHALTVLYYEVLRNFKVEVELARERDVLLIEHPTPNFTEEMAFKNRQALEAALLDDNLSDCFDVLDEVWCLRKTFHPPEVADEEWEGDLEFDEYSIEIGTGDKGTKGRVEISLADVEGNEHQLTVKGTSDPNLNGQTFFKKMTQICSRLRVTRHSRGKNCRV